VNSSDAKSAWTIRGHFDEKDWGVALRGPTGVVRLVQDNSQEQQWYIRQTPSGAYRYVSLACLAKICRDAHKQSAGSRM
jgi:hypothetical protein